MSVMALIKQFVAKGDFSDTAKVMGSVILGKLHQKPILTLRSYSTLIKSLHALTCKIN